MRQDWFGRIPDILRDIETAKQETFDLSEIMTLFRLKRSAAYDIMTAVKPLTIGECTTRGPVASQDLKAFLEEVRGILGDSPGREEVKRAQAFLHERRRPKTHISAQTNDVLEAKPAYPKPLTILIDEQLDSILTSQSNALSISPEKILDGILCAWFRLKATSSEGDRSGTIRRTDESSGPFERERQYQVLIFPRSPHKDFYAQHRGGLGKILSILKEVAKQKGSTIVGNIRTDYVHIKISVPPNCTLSSVVDLLKVESVVQLVQVSKQQEGSFSGQDFWEPGFFLSTEKLDEAAIRDFIPNQE